MDLTGDIKIVKDGYGNTFAARTVILAMGSGYRKLGLDGRGPAVRPRRLLVCHL